MMLKQKAHKVLADAAETGIPAQENPVGVAETAAIEASLAKPTEGLWFIPAESFQGARLAPARPTEPRISILEFILAPG